MVVFGRSPPLLIVCLSLNPDVEDAMISVGCCSCVENLCHDRLGPEAPFLNVYSYFFTSLNITFLLYESTDRPSDDQCGSNPASTKLMCCIAGLSVCW